MTLRKHLLAGAAALAAAGAVVAAPYPHGGSAPAALDLGDSAAIESSAQITVTVALQLSNREQLEALIKSVYTPGSAQYRQFITPQEFQQRFAPDAASVAAVTREFSAQGLKVTRSATAQLHVSGTAAQIEKAFAVELHSYEVPATRSTPAYRYRAPLGAAHVASAVAGSVTAVLGLDTQPKLHPNLRPALQGPSKETLNPQHHGGSVNTPDPPGEWTVLDYADYYDVNPLYRSGLTGKGRTLAIVTLASFTQSDAYTYWQAVGLKVNPNRITEVQIDGGAGPPSDAAGSDETTLDVEQSGGLAPGASILVYEAPNTSQGFVDGIAAAIDSNSADSISTSWGLWELFDSANSFGNGPVTNPVTGQQSTILQAYDDLLAQGALQGQTFFVASGDAGAYGSVAALPTAPSPGQPYSFNPVLSVEDPAVQRFVTATGGTTLPGQQVYATPSGGTITINIAQEQAWNWEYLAPLCEQVLGGPANCLFPEGTGGGVSLYVARPFYQWFTPNMKNSPPGQVLTQLTPAPAQVIAKLPAGYPGRNVPDISTNGDPQTGYLLYYTSSVNGFEIATYGGTSFVAPQLNGVTSLYVQALHHRIGLLNPALYLIENSPLGYYGRGAAFNDITASNNWYWNALRGYDQTTGVGTPDVANLLDALRFIGY
ncbi:MAG TPA: S53 family peptidase [Steroidobacteraceae bacterium]|jgi:kumamolisin|nr:S53 family peptidase [Steroidobacteraceae bacterium]